MRLFVALLLDEDVRNALAVFQRKLGRACSGVRWTSPEQMHLTVQFLGEVRDRDVAKVSEALERAAKVGPFAMELAGAGCFPNKGPVRVVWVGARDQGGALLQCVQDVAAELERVGFPRERRPFSGHITIGRVREDRSQGAIRAAVEAATLKPLEQRVRALSLMSSVLSSKGPTYAIVSSAPLGQSQSQTSAR